jgi:electron transfer flavoprotein beta subunit
VKIAVLAKEVPDLEAKIGVASGGAALEIEKRRMLNFFDEIALEAALQVKQAQGGEVYVVSAAAPGTGVEALRRCLAMGADSAHLIEDPALEEASPLTVARALAAVVSREGHDLILAGKQATDDEAGLVGPMVAEMLGLPCVTAAVSLELVDGAALVSRETAGGRETLRASLPVLVTAEKGLAEPRVPGVAGMMKAMKAQVPRLSLAELGVEVSPPVPVAAYRTSGDRPPVKLIEGEPAEAAAALVRLLREEARVL